MSHENTIRILVSSDNHLGHNYKDPILKDDSFITFEEILNIAKKQQVDFVLLAGDLFHVNKPKRETLHKTLKL